MSKSSIDEEFVSELAFEIEVLETYGCAEYSSSFILLLIEKYNGTFCSVEQIKAWGELITMKLHYDRKCNFKEIARDLIEYFELRKTKPNLMERIINYLKGK